MTTKTKTQAVEGLSLLARVSRYRRLLALVVSLVAVAALWSTAGGLARADEPSPSPSPSPVIEGSPSPESSEAPWPSPATEPSSGSSEEPSPSPTPSAGSEEVAWTADQVDGLLNAARLLVFVGFVAMCQAWGR